MPLPTLELYLQYRTSQCKYNPWPNATPNLATLDPSLWSVIEISVPYFAPSGAPVSLASPASTFNANAICSPYVSNTTIHLLHRLDNNVDLVGP
ncbi:hypothetical protein GOP47_0031078 [Adiantum capillus-veneris]|nr:hypothetical protein GOP47_0031078 [Adiantum capillus-veneris]